MADHAAAAVLATLLLAAPAAAQKVDLAASPLDGRWIVPVEPELSLDRSGLSLPVVEYEAPAGGLKIRRGIVASVEVGPNTLVGVGFYETLPKGQNISPEDPLDLKPKRRRKAAVGISFRF